MKFEKKERNILKRKKERKKRSSKQKERKERSSKQKERKKRSFSLSLDQALRLKLIIVQQQTQKTPIQGSSQYKLNLGNCQHKQHLRNKVLFLILNVLFIFGYSF